MHHRFLHGSFVIVAVAAILAATLLPVAGAEPGVWHSCIVCGDRGTADVLVNILLFLPLGAALAVAGVPLSRCVLGGALLSAGIEVAQFYVPGRDPSLGDVLANTLGSGLGVVLVSAAPRWVLPAGAQATRLSRTAACIGAALCYLTGWLLSPALPQLPYLALWTPNLGRLEWYRGRVREVTLGDASLPAGPIANSAAVREQLLADRGFSLRVRAIVGPRTDALGGLLVIDDERRREVLLLGPDRDDLVFRFRTRNVALHLRLDTPDIRLSNALRSAKPGDTLTVTVNGRRGRYSMTANSFRADGLGYTVGSGWALLVYPNATPAWLKTLFDFAWIAALWTPAGFWARTRRDAWWIVGAVAVGLLGTPAVTPLMATPLLQWAAAGLGGLAGVVVRVAVSRARLVPPSTVSKTLAG
ncbi:MAG: VanZ family protein [Gemmatimonadales bacterium]